MQLQITLAALILIVLSTVAFAQEREADIEQDLDRQYERLELQERQAELEFQREMRGLELERQRAEIQRLRHEGHDPGRGGLALLLAVVVVVHLLLAIWVYQDMRKRNAGSGLWVAIVLLAGCCGALVYAVVRLGDVKEREG